jgi:hypothetical protein
LTDLREYVGVPPRQIALHRKPASGIALDLVRRRVKLDRSQARGTSASAPERRTADGPNPWRLHASSVLNGLLEAAGVSSSRLHRPRRGASERARPGPHRCLRTQARVRSFHRPRVGGSPPARAGESGGPDRGGTQDPGDCSPGTQVARTSTRPGRRPRPRGRAVRSPRLEGPYRVRRTTPLTRSLHLAPTVIRYCIYWVDGPWLAHTFARISERAGSSCRPNASGGCHARPTTGRLRRSVRLPSGWVGHSKHALRRGKAAVAASIMSLLTKAARLTVAISTEMTAEQAAVLAY